MISERALGTAITKGVLTPDQAEALRAIEPDTPAARDAPPGRERIDDEALRFVSGFADIFVTIGIVLFVGALAFLVSQAAGSTATWWAVAAAAWLLAELFTRRRRMALPSIVLLIVFAGAAFLGIAAVLASGVAPGATPFRRGWPFPTVGGMTLAAAGLGTVLLVALHFFRFRVPITVAAGMTASLVAILGLVLAVDPEASAPLVNGLLFAWGMLCFGLAMRFDLSDPARETRRTDTAFWLHLLAAPLIVHTLVRGLLPGVPTGPTTTVAVGFLGVFALLGLVAVVIDRRAILVSGLVYAGIAFGSLIRPLVHGEANLLVPVVLLSLGAFILLLSAGWQPLRRALLRQLPAGLARRLPHPTIASAS